MLSPNDIRMVAPALERYTQDPLLGGVWKRPGLTPRDRSIVTLAAVIARNQTIEMPYYVNLALDSDVKPREISEMITHRFYSGRANALSAVAVAREVFAERRIGIKELPPASPQLLPLDEAAEAQRVSRVGEQFGNVAPGVVQYTTDVLFRDLWLRPDLVPRDRSLVTVSALIASGQVAQLGGHLSRAMDNGLTQAQAAEVMTHLAFYAGWPNVFRPCRWRKTSSRSVRSEGRQEALPRERPVAFLAGVGHRVLADDASREAARSFHVKEQRRPSRGPYASICCSTRPLPSRTSGGLCEIRTRRAVGLAHAPAGADAHRDGRLRLGPALGRSDPGNPAGRRRLVPAGEKHWHGATADHGHDAHRRSGTPRRQSGRVDGTGQRRAIRK